MAQQRYQGPDGTIYEELPGGGYAVVGPEPQAQAPSPYTIGTPDPAAAYQAPKAAADLESARISAARAAATAPYDVPKAQADAEAARLAAEKARRELSAPTTQQGEIRDRLSRLGQLAKQVRRTQELYDTGIGTTKGIAGIQDYLPNDDNARFDVAGASLSQQGLAAFRVPGTGTVSDRDAMMFDRANLPTASTRDSAVEEQLRSIRSRVDEEMKALGQAPVNWDQTQVPPAIGSPPANEQRQGAIPGAGPRYFDGGTGPGGPQLNGGGGTQTVADPTKAGVAARLNELLRSGAPDARVQAYAASVGADPASLASVLAFRKQNPGYRGNYNASDLELKEQDLGLIREGLNWAAQTKGGAFAINAADALTAGTLDNLTDNPALARAGLAGVQQANPYSSLAGTISGSALAAAGAEFGLGRAGLTAGRAALGGDALYGAAYGAGTTDEGNRLLGAAVGGVAGAGGGVVGRRVADGVGSALTGVRNADVTALRGAGVPLTVGQAVGSSGIVGRTVKGIEDRLSGLPVVGDLVNARRREGFEGFNRAAFDQGLAPINANTGGQIGEAGIDVARGARSQAYSDALDPVRVQADAPFVTDMQSTIAAGRALPDPMRGNLDYTLPTRVGNSFDNTGGLTGNDFQQSVRGLRRDAKSMEQLPYGHDFGQVTRQAEGALEGLLARQSPDTLPAYNAANAANRNVEVLRDAVNRARNGTRTGETGVFAPSQLADAAAANARKFGNSAGTTNQPFFDLTRAGQSVLPNAVPDSGTAGRAVVAGGLGLAGLGGAGGYAAGDAQTGAAGGLSLAALLAAGGTRTGQKWLTKALLDRPDVLVRLGEGVQRQSRLGGLFGAPMLAGGATSLLQQ